MPFRVKKTENRPRNVLIYDRISRSLILKLAWKSFQALKLSHSLTFPRMLDKMLKFPDFSLFFQGNIEFLDFSRFSRSSRLCNNPDNIHKQSLACWIIRIFVCMLWQKMCVTSTKTQLNHALLEFSSVLINYFILIFYCQILNMYCEVFLSSYMIHNICLLIFQAPHLLWCNLDLPSIIESIAKFARKTRNAAK